ncbi:lipopolysaccharide biosynthesis protein wzxC [Fermentimonas caenicola]|uniref:Lipopolysaccharide biosynthesis protein wzxC n=1 Tax=Fermentimonas caenicola TaxID=1562970 RepID=A0A098C046_9BACT|nr:lipopolysaccharide biosynthesis protein wzxC [Fermentimonas caenicola]
MSSSLKKQAVSGVLWSFGQQFSVQIINFVVQIILARLLMPEMFGLIAMLTVFISIGQSLMDAGMTSSLIRSKNPDQLDYSTVFLTNLMISVSVYIITYLSAPYIAQFYSQEILKDILRIYALTFVIHSFVAVHIAKMTKEMNFKTQMILQIPSTIVGAIVGVTMAYLGYGVWSLVWLHIAQSIVYTLQIWIFVPWRPSFVFNKRRFKYHFNFGYKLTLSGLLDTVYNDAYRIVIGKFFTPAAVGFFNQAETMRLFPVQQISSVMGKVTYPLFSNINGDAQLKNAYKSTMKLILFAVIPIMLILIVVAKEGFLLLFGEKWLPSVLYFQILATASIIRPISSYNLNILKVKGRSDLFLKVEIIKKVIGVIGIAVALPFGIKALVISLTAVSFIFVFINMFYCGKLIDYSVLNQIKDVGKLFIAGLVTFLLTVFIREYLITYTQNNLLIISLISLSFSVLYLGIITITDKEIIRSLKSIYKL